MLLSLVSIWAFINRAVLVYGFRQAKGQLNIIFNTVPVDKIMADPTFPDSLKQKINLIKEIKQFATDSLGLEPVGSYNTYFEQNGEPILWVLVAAEPYRLKAYTWRFPILGEFQYKGFFDKKLGEKEAITWQQKGFDVRLREVSAWSTLGYLDDPILSSMLDLPEGDLAALIIHEMTHSSIFIKNNLTFNENLADFVGDYGAKQFLAKKYGIKSKVYRRYLDDIAYNQMFRRHILVGTQKLDSLYKTFDTQNASKYLKDSLKYNLIDQIFEKTDTLSIKRKLKYKGRGSVNNAYFVAYKTYQARQNQFEVAFKERFNENFKAYWAYLKGNEGNLEE